MTHPALLSENPPDVASEQVTEKRHLHKFTRLVYTVYTIHLSNQNHGQMRASPQLRSKTTHSRPNLSSAIESNPLPICTRTSRYLHKHLFRQSHSRPSPPSRADKWRQVTVSIPQIRRQVFTAVRHRTVRKHKHVVRLPARGRRRGTAPGLPRRGATRRRSVTWCGTARLLAPTRRPQPRRALLSARCCSAQTSPGDRAAQRHCACRPQADWNKASTTG